MYLRETLETCSGHSLHVHFMEAAKIIFPVDCEDGIMKKLLYWGEEVDVFSLWTI